MGSSESRVVDGAATPQQKNQPPTTNSLQDPRSPSENVNRTPMKVERSSFDPRSPSQNVNRTPLQISNSEMSRANGKCDVRQVLNYSPEKLAHERMPLVEKNN